MAKFNPDVSDANPKEYLSYSHPISDVGGDKSLGTALESLGGLVNTAAKAGEFVVKTDIDNRVYGAVDAARDAETNRLQGIKNSYQGKYGAVPSDVVPEGSEALAYAPQEGTSSSATLFGKDTPPPEGVSNGLNRVSTVQGARANGKMTETDYIAEVRNIAKDLRTLYPGWRDYIDEKISSTTGFNPANALMKSLVQDINSYVTAQSSAQNKVLNDIRKHPELPDMPLWEQAFREGRASETQVYQWLNKNLAYKHTVDLSDANRKLRTNDLSNYKDDAERQVAFEGARAVDKFMDTIAISVPGINATKMSQVLDDIASGKLQPTPEQATALGQQVTGFMNMFKQQMRKDLNRIQVDSSGRSFSRATDLGGQDAANKQIDAAAVPFQTMIDAFINKDSSWAVRAAKMTTAKIDQATAGMLEDVNLGRTFMLKAIADRLGGQAGVADIITKQALVSGKVERGIKQWLEATTYDAIAQPDAATGKPTTISASTDALKNKKVQSATSYNSLIDLTNEITNPKLGDDAKVNLFKYSFGEGNENFLQRFKRDDVVDGRRVPGQYSVYARMGSPAITAEAVRLGQKNPEVLRDYTRWMSEQFAALFGNELRDNAQRPLQNGVKILWDDKTNQFKMSVGGNDNYLYTGPGVGNPGPRAPRARLTDVPQDRVLEEQRKSLVRINWGLSNLAKSNEAIGSNTSVQLLNFINRLSAGSGSVVRGTKEESVNSINDAILESVRASLAAGRTPSSPGFNR